MNVRRLTASALGLGIFLLLASASSGHFREVEVQKVPVERLVANLERAVKKNPQDVQAVVNLARVHGMAYARKTDTAELAKGREDRGPWFGYHPKTIPFSEVKRTDDKAKQEEAKLHLSKAVLGFREAVKLAPDNVAARMGLAWTLDQSGEKTAAIKQYRELIEDAWKSEKDMDSLPLNGETIVTEATGYLVPLLDKEKDKAEITTLRDRVARLRKLGRPITPIALPLRDGLGAGDIEDRGASVTFDADGSVSTKSWTWITKDAGWLVYDPKNEGSITSGLQLFGSVTFWLFWQTGYDALAALDDNHDGELRGRELAGLAVWHDSAHQGVCDPGEVKPLSEYGIVAVSCRFERDVNHPDQIAFSAGGVTFRDGTTRPTFDIILKPIDRESATGSAHR
jgi:hypothetical protein